MTEQSSRSPHSEENNELLEQSSFLSGTNAAFIESLYARYQENPEAVDASWRVYFAELDERGLSPTQLGRGPAWRRDAKVQVENGELVDPLTGQWPAKTSGTVSEQDLRASAQESIRAIQLYRRRTGHRTSGGRSRYPLKLTRRRCLARPEFLRIPCGRPGPADFLDGLLGLETATPADVDCSSAPIAGIGYEFMHINDPEQKDG